MKFLLETSERLYADQSDKVKLLEQIKRLTNKGCHQQAQILFTKHFGVVA